MSTWGRVAIVTSHAVRRVTSFPRGSSRRWRRCWSPEPFVPPPEGHPRPRNALCERGPWKSPTRSAVDRSGVRWLRSASAGRERQDDSLEGRTRSAVVLLVDTGATP
ncbi:unnamed protein product [Lampetra planeri]